MTELAGTVTPVNPEPLPMKMLVVVPPKVRLDANWVAVMLAGASFALGEQADEGGPCSR